MNQLTDRSGNLLPIASTADWDARRTAAFEAMAEVMGPLPGQEKRCPLEVERIDERDCGSYIRRSIAYRSEPGSRVPALLLIPKDVLLTGRRVPGILCCHGANWFQGHHSMANPDNTADPGYGAQLAERGYVVLCPAYPLQGGYFPRLAELGYVSGTMKAIWDNMRGLDLLETLPWIRSGGFGAIGLSQGGYNTAFTAAFDERLTAVVISAGFDSFQVYMDGDLTCWGEPRHMPKLLDYPIADIPFDFHDVIAAIAPRRCFVSAPRRDFFKVESVQEIVRAARMVYGCLGAADRLVVEHPDCGHAFPPASRAAAFAFLDEALGFEPRPTRNVAMVQVDAFVGPRFTGNPAAVCFLDAWLGDRQLQAIAAENNLSETAFLVPAGDGFELRWFTPVREVALCGHATLAAAFALYASRGWAAERVVFHTRWKGVLTVVRDGDLLEMDFPAVRPTPIAPPDGLAAALGCRVVGFYAADEDLLAELPDEETVRNLAPDMAALATVACRGVIVTAAGVEADVVSRFFAPRCGIPEDPVTGSAHCALTPYWSARLGKEALLAHQLSGRGGEVHCRLRGDRVLLAGRAAHYLTGVISVEAEH